MNYIGLAAGLATFIGIWVGHVLVRKIEHQSDSIRLPAICFTIIGIILQIGAFLSNTQIGSAVLGILSVTALWDAYEFARQEQRVIHGHSPANPFNPRHVKILEQHTSATTLDLLKRNPIGREVNSEEAMKLIAVKAKL